MTFHHRHPDVSRKAMKTREVDGVIDCDKVPYYTRKEAKQFHKRLKNLGRALDGYVYHCEKCGFYHVTSINKNERYKVSQIMKRK